jgi:hypothetical protein
MGALAVMLGPSVTHAQYVLEDLYNPKRYAPDTLVVPVAYYSTSLEFAGGLAGYTNGLFQRQVQEYEFVIGSTDASYGAVVGLSSLQIRPIDRLFFDFDMTYFVTERDENNVNGSRRFPDQTAGDNASSEHNYVAGPSRDLIGNFTFKYLLPIGNGKDVIIDHYCLHDGLLHSNASGGEGFDPFSSGRTFIELSPQFEYLDIRSHRAERHQWDTDNLQLSAVYDNRDWPLTPSRGNLTTLSVTRDFGVLGSSNPWTNLSAEFAEYIPLGQSNLFRQEVLALDAWTSYSPTWHQRGEPGHLDISTAPPFYDGAQLGGMNRMRGYPEERFHDRAGVYACAELRLIPYWNPLNEIPLFKSSDIAWMQFVTFVEVGRVADAYTFDKLFSQMKIDGGIGLRILTQDTVVRFDVAGSSEGFQIWANLDQAF